MPNITMNFDILAMLKLQSSSIICCHIKIYKNKNERRSINTTFEPYQTHDKSYSSQNIDTYYEKNINIHKGKTSNHL